MRQIFYAPLLALFISVVTLAGISLAYSQTLNVGPQTLGRAPAGQVPAASDATVPCATCVGATLRSFVSGATPTTGFATGTAKDVTSQALTGGQWTCWGSINTNPAASTTTSGVYGGLSLTADTLPTDTANRYMGDTLSAAANLQISIPIMPQIFNVAGAGATVHLVGRAGFSVSTMGMSGFLTCQRTA